MRNWDENDENKLALKILSVVDSDISEIFINVDPSCYALDMPLNIHIARHIKIIASKLNQPFDNNIKSK